MLTLDLRQSLELTDDQFEKICQANQNLKFERTATGELIIMSLTGGETGERNASLTGQLWLWNRQSKLGHAFDSSTGFRLPNGAIRSPDAAWISQERWQELTAQQRRKIVPLCPDFVVELCSPSDNLEDVQLKMQEFLENGIKLGWLIDPETKTVEIYRPNQEREILHHPITLSEEALLPGFSLDLSDVLAD
ncbi:MAG: Uma2 family endonuclease [Desertifilum sp.]|nr:Uma2 family endonuclease [Desertifilum sp.]